MRKVSARRDLLGVTPPVVAAFRGRGHSLIRASSGSTGPEFVLVARKPMLGSVDALGLRSLRRHAVLRTDAARVERRSASAGYPCELLHRGSSPVGARHRAGAVGADHETQSSAARAMSACELTSASRPRSRTPINRSSRTAGRGAGGAAGGLDRRERAPKGGFHADREEIAAAWHE